MSTADRDKWNRRYAEGAYEERTHPSAFLEAWREKLAPGRALDVACGAGRNSLWLAELGFVVDAVDISGRALERLDQAAEARGLAVNTIEHDLDSPPLPKAQYDLIVMIRYVNLPLLAELASWLSPGGWLLCEEHVQSDAVVIGPSNPDYRVAPGALAQAVGSLEVVSVEEGVVAEPDGRHAALARIAARRGS